MHHDENPGNHYLQPHKRRQVLSHFLNSPHPHHGLVRPQDLQW
uniref:Uncharacterized protein n=1 Tax=Anguilla anguilla TaxID=7936 RepID=A0A0E9S3M7_ANGAN